MKDQRRGGDVVFGRFSASVPTKGGTGIAQETLAGQEISPLAPKRLDAEVKKALLNSVGKKNWRTFPNEEDNMVWLGCLLTKQHLESIVSGTREDVIASIERVLSNLGIEGGAANAIDEGDSRVFSSAFIEIPEAQYQKLVKAKDGNVVWPTKFLARKAVATEGVVTWPVKSPPPEHAMLKTQRLNRHILKMLADPHENWSRYTLDDGKTIRAQTFNLEALEATKEEFEACAKQIFKLLKLPSPRLYQLDPLEITMTMSPAEFLSARTKAARTIESPSR